MNEQRVSVIIAAYNAARYIAEALHSALAQTHGEPELIVVDDGSTDNTIEIVSELAPRANVIRQRNAGAGAARNRGVTEATGEFITFLDADDRFTREKLAVQLAAFDRDPALEAVYGHVREFISEDISAEAVAKLRDPVESAPSHLGGSLLIRREAFLRVGPFAERYSLGEGLDWYARSQEAGIYELTLPDIVLERRLHGSNTGIERAAETDQFLQIVRAALQRRRAQGSA